MTGVTQGAHGTVVNNNDGTVTYTPNADYNGTDSYTYTVTSGGVTETATVNVTIDPVADIADDSDTTDEDTAVTTNVLANDSFEDAGAAVTSVTQGAHGSVANNNDGTVTYTPDADYNGSDSYTYTVTSGGVTETATVNVTINAVADIADDSDSTNEDNSVTTNVLANDTFEDAGAAVTAVTQGAHGTVVNNNDGTVTYTPNADYNGPDSYTYTVTSGGVTETATVNVTINAVADIADDSDSTNEDVRVTTERAGERHASRAPAQRHGRHPRCARQRSQQRRRHRHLHPERRLQRLGQLHLHGDLGRRDRDRDGQRDGQCRSRTSPTTATAPTKTCGHHQRARQRYVRGIAVGHGSDPGRARHGGEQQ